MHEHRFLYRKEDAARYISHLDTMRTFQRALARAEIAVQFTQGYHPHADVSIPLPLPVGFSSDCEVLECTILGEVPLEEAPDRLNRVLPRGLTVLECRGAEQPAKALAWVDYRVELEYDGGVPPQWEEKVSALLARESWVVEKKSKKSRTGFTTLDIIPLIRSAAWERGEGAVALTCRLAAQNPGLNPQVLVEALGREEGLAPDFARFRRLSLWNGQEEPFR